ncbi:MAG: hypothetical protein ACXWJD_03995 [Burkholderiaceae bacterium]
MNNQLREKLQNIVASWDKAPTTTKMIAGAYVAPIIALLTEIVEVINHGNTTEK